jgi:2-succinyl-5-enolpyruvyl-6-hydroxy-3-cyclohexene-1-carboxylate synthase
LFDGRVARDVCASLPDGTHLLVASSMPVRDLEWFAAPRSGISVHANRGVNGIDGLVSTAVGIATGSGAPTVALLGDLALLHDSNGLIGLADAPIDLTLVVVDNDGGGIFSFLPQAEACPREEFETLFGTPHGMDLEALMRVHGLAVVTPTRAGAVTGAVRDCIAKGGVRAVLVRTDRAANVGRHRAVWEAVSAAVRV